MAPPADLRAWIALLEREGELVRIEAEVDPELEITEITDRTVKAGGPALLLGDYLYAHGLVRIEEVGTVEAVSDLAELIALCAYLRAEEIAGDGPVWAATAALLGRGELEEGRSSLRLDNDPIPLERLARSRVGDAATDGALATHRGRLR